ncbi:methyltransferase [Nitrincola alkalisediminis]|uniref:methyltransferase n=1 Tax=Nitrincola alkalisediminis TaxID=1366656 RepID=UPI001873C78C|nr:methyltransferase [Nitrincola alkalisediminis]
MQTFPHSFKGLFEHWQTLDTWLVAHRELWHQAPFYQPQPDWALKHLELSSALQELTDQQCTFFETHPIELTQHIQHALPSLGEAIRLSQTPVLEGPSMALPEVKASGMPGRKRLQAGAFTGALLPLPHSIVDWCCGCGHLARTLAPHVCHVVGLEWNPTLVEKGNKTAKKYRDAVELRHQDVMSPSLHLPIDAHVVALHACGDLHRHLLSHAANIKSKRISLSPCCYHLSQHKQWQPLSQRARTSSLIPVEFSTLRLAVQETVTAPQRVTLQRLQMTDWRLGFDELRRHLWPLEPISPLPSAPNHLVQGDFEGFCRWALDTIQRPLTNPCHWKTWEERGKARAKTLRRYELLRHLFRRPLEIWLVLDYVLLLEEQGYEVQWGTFCERQLTPRNLLIDARLGKSETE